MAAEPLAGRTIGKYRLVEQLGRGGMAEVYKAYQPGLDRYVAIKLMHSFLAEDPDFLARFQREAKLVASLRHPNIVQVHDFDVENGLYYMVMEYIDGETLKGRLQHLEEQNQWISIEEAVRMISAVGSALKYAHRMGMVHRDVKPANVMVDKHGSIILTDFGIAKIFSGGGAGTQLTATGAMVGTPSYMAPEQGMGQPGDERSDIYSLGVMLYQLVTGRLPYEADTPLAVVLKHINEALPMPRQVNAEVPEPVERIILKAMAKNPDDRYQHVGDMLSDLRRAMGMTLDDTPTDTMRGRALPAGATAAGTGSITPFPTSARATVARPPSSPTVVSSATPAPMAAPIAAPARRRGLAAGLAALGVAGLVLVIAIGVVIALVMNNRRSFQAAAAATSTARALADIIPTPTETLAPRPTATATPPSFVGTVKSDGAELRTSAVESGALVGLIPKNTKLTLRARTADNKWFRVEASDGTTGWMLASALDLTGVAVAQIPEALALIAPTATPNLTATAAACKPVAQVSDASVPAGTQFKPGESFVKVWKLTNSGNCAWEKDTKLVYQSGDKFGPESIAIASVKVGDSLQVSTTIQAPQTPGSYKRVWALKRPSGDAIGTAEISIVVPGPTPTRYVPPTTAPVVTQPTATPKPAVTTIGPVGTGPLQAGYGGPTNCRSWWEGDGDEAYVKWESDFVISVHGGTAGYQILNAPNCRWDTAGQVFLCRWEGRQGGVFLQSVTVTCPGCPQIKVDIAAEIKQGKTMGSCVW